MEDIVVSEYQRYEFMTIDQLLTKVQLNAVNALSSHIEASATHAVIEYNWGSFKHDRIDVLHKFFDGFLYWANWGSPEFALRFPHGILPANLIEDYDLDEFVTFTRHKNYDILDIHFGEMEAPDRWAEYELGSLIAIRDELMTGDLRALYIAWLAAQNALNGYYDDEEDNEHKELDEEEEDDELRGVPPVPPNFANLTEAQEALAELLQVPQELLVAVAQHSQKSISAMSDDFVAWVELLPQERRNDYLVRLANNEPGLSRQLIRELRELGQGKTKTTQPTGERVTYRKLLAESEDIRTRQEREQREQEQLARQRHLQDVHDHWEDYWHQVEVAVARGNATGYDEGLRLLIDLRAAADQFKESQEFQARLHNWVRSYMRRPAFIKRLQDNKFSLPGA
jgi:hypothetical protein